MINQPAGGIFHLLLCFDGVRARSQVACPRRLSRLALLSLLGLLGLLTLLKLLCLLELLGLLELLSLLHLLGLLKLLSLLRRLPLLLPLLRRLALCHLRRMLRQIRIADEVSGATIPGRIRLVAPDFALSGLIGVHGLRKGGRRGRERASNIGCP